MVILTDADSYGLEIHQAYLHGKVMGVVYIKRKGSLYC